MFRIRLLSRALGEREWQPLAEGQSSLSMPEVQASESDLLWLEVFPPQGVVPAIRLRVGDVLVASTLAIDRVSRIEWDDDSPSLSCRGHFLADWVGLTELTVEIRIGDESTWSNALTLPLAVSAGKLSSERFDLLFADLERESSAVLLDIHGKTRVGLKAVRPSPVSSTAPAALLSRLRSTITELNESLHRIARSPASRLKVQVSREQSLVGQAVSEATLAEACIDPSILGRRGREIVFREHLSEHSGIDFNLVEHRSIADFAEFLKVQLSDLRRRIDGEIEERENRRRWRDRPTKTGGPTWWETEDKPRLEELTRCRTDLSKLHGVVDSWSRMPFLPAGKCLTHRPLSTALFRNHAAYHVVFRLMASHFQTYQATLDTQSIITRVRSLPVLYEWWCTVRVIRVLTRMLLPSKFDNGSSPFSTPLSKEGRGFTVEFVADQEINFVDIAGNRIRFRYQPLYREEYRRPAPLSAGAECTPDMALEVFLKENASEMPDTIIVLDAKYSVSAQRDKLIDVGAKYGKIGDLKTGQVLSRQVWAMTPAAPERPGWDGLRRTCTVDNDGFWSDGFEAGNPVVGAVQALPTRPGEFDSIAALVGKLLEMAGVRFLENPASGVA